MPLLFAYDTLQHEDVQMAALGRPLQGKKDELAWFEHSTAPFADAEAVSHRSTVTFNGEFESRVSGTLYEITDAELEAADRYKAAAGYERITTRTMSGKQAWVYVHAHAK